LTTPPEAYDADDDDELDAADLGVNDAEDGQDVPHDIDRVMREFHAENKRRGWYTIGGALLLAILLVTALTFLNPPQPNTSKMGIHMLLDDGRTQFDPSVWESHLQYASQVGNYVTELIRLDDLDPTKWQRFFDLCRQYELTPIIRLATTFDTENNWWIAPPADDNGTYRTVGGQYAAFFSAIQWDGELFVLVGNEPNHGEEWGGVPDPAAYTRFLSDVAQAVKDAHSGVRIGNAAIDHYAPNTNAEPFENGIAYLDGESFMDAMVAADSNITRVLDVWNSHAYSMTPPWEQQYQVDYLNGAGNPNALAPVEGLSNRGVNSYNWELYKLSQLGNLKVLPVIISETGWSRDRYSDEEIAQYMDLSYFGNHGRYADLPEEGWVPWIEDTRVLAVTPFALAGSPNEWDAYNWLDVEPYGTITGTRPVFDVIAAQFDSSS
jgi:hypothetical protein